MAVEDTYSEDDWFDLDKYRQAAGVAYEFSKRKWKKLASKNDQQ